LCTWIWNKPSVFGVIRMTTRVVLKSRSSRICGLTLELVISSRWFQRITVFFVKCVISPYPVFPYPSVGIVNTNA
jgi:hypothetical protein